MRRPDDPPDHFLVRLTGKILSGRGVFFLPRRPSALLITQTMTGSACLQAPEGRRAPSSLRATNSVSRGCALQVQTPPNPLPETKAGNAGTASEIAQLPTPEPLPDLQGHERHPSPRTAPSARMRRAFKRLSGVQLPARKPQIRNSAGRRPPGPDLAMHAQAAGPTQRLTRASR